MSFITSPGVIVPPLTAGGVAYGTGSQAKVNSAGTVGQVLTSAGAGVPTWATPASITYPITVPNGGTGLTTLTQNNVILGNGGSNPTFVAPSTTGNVLTSNGTTWSSQPASGGGITWTTKTTTYTAVNGDYLFCDTSSAAFTITLPASPTINDTVYFQDAKGSFNSNALTIAPGSNNIMGSSGDLVVTLLNAGFGLFYNGTEWRIF